ncbi:MAG: amino acid racemase [Burkholderiaceae bacterium]
MNTSLHSRRLTVGILGGMGPLATADLMMRIIEQTRADGDQDHVPVIVASLPQMPSRIAAITARGPTPLPAMRDALRRLEAAGAELIAMPCNTAHFWYDELCRSTRLPFLHIVDSVIGGLDPSRRRIGVLASSATVQAGIYASRLRARGFDVIEPAAGLPRLRCDEAIAAVKAGRIAKGAALLRPVARRLADDGAEAIVLGCTEFPIAARAQAWPPGVPLIDATLALARACVAASAPDLLAPLSVTRSPSVSA